MPQPLPSFIALTLGICLILGSNLITTKSPAATGWTEEDAKEFQRVSMHLHDAMSHQEHKHEHGAAETADTTKSATNHQQHLADARSQMDEQVKKKEAALSRGSWKKTITRWLGFGFVLCGVVLYIAARINEDNEN